MPDPFWFNGFSLRLQVGSSGLLDYDVIPHHYNHKKGCLELMNKDDRHLFFKNLNRLNDILASGNQNQRYFSADSESFTEYADFLSKFTKNLSNNSWETTAEKQTAKAFHHFLTCNEHWDLLEALSLRKWQGDVDVPEDLKEITQSLGRTF